MEKFDVAGTSNPENRHLDPPRMIYVITGRVQGGKTRFLSQLVHGLKEDGIKISGFLSRGTFKAGKRYEFSLVNLANDLQIPLASVEKKEGWQKYRRFYFNPQAFVTGESWIRDGVSGHPDLVVIDEVGPMEQERLGWWDLLNFVDVHHHSSQLWVVREQMLEEITRQWNVPPENIFRIDGSDHTELMLDISGKMAESRKS